MVNTTDKLPENYSQVFKIDLAKDKKTMVLVNLLSLLIGFIMLIIGVAIYILPTIRAQGSWNWNIEFNKSLIVIFSLFAYLILHELIHGIFMRAFSGVKVKYGITPLYAFAGSAAYFNKKHYIIIALAPLVILGTILLVLNILLPSSWSWIVFIIQGINISGAAGDMYVFSKIKCFNDDILINDVGVSMTIYSNTSK